MPNLNGFEQMRVQDMSYDEFCIAAFDKDADDKKAWMEENLSHGAFALTNEDIDFYIKNNGK